MSAGKNIWGIIKDSPPWAKGILILGTGAAAYFAGLSIYRRFRDKAKEEAADKISQQTLDTANSTLDNLKKSGVQPTYPESQYQAWADAAYACYNGWGTCETDTIFVNLKNDADMYALIKAFGIRTISSGKWNPTPDFRGNFPAVVRDELNDWQVQEVNKVLAKNGLTFKF